MSQPRTDSTYRGPEIPEALGEQIRRVLGLDQRPDVFSDWVEALARIAERDGFEMNMDALCTTADSPHQARFGDESKYYRCVQDPIIVPFLVDDVDTVEIETRSPVSDSPIELVVTEEGIDSAPADAVFSFGVDASVDGPPDAGVSPAFAYGRFCPYGHAFPSEQEYEEWAEEVDAYTMAVSMSDTFEWARALGDISR